MKNTVSLKSFITKILPVGLSLFLVGCGVASNEDLQAGQTDDRQHAGRRLVIYTTTRPDFYEPLLAAFEYETGIQLDFMTAGAGELLSRVRGEAANPIADIMFGGLLSTVSANSDLFEYFLSDNEPYIIEHFRNIEGNLTRFHHSGSVLMVNTDFIGDIQINGYADLLNPELRGRIAMTDPAASGSAFEHLVNKLYAMGNGNPHQGWDFVNALMENVDGAMLGSSSAVTRAVADGEMWVGLTFEEGPMPYIVAGAPVKIVYMQEGVIFNAGGVYIVNNTPNRDIAELFVNFVTSYEPQVYMEQNLHRRSVRTDVTTDGLLTPLNEINVIFDDATYVAQNRDMWLDMFRDVLMNTSN